MNYQKETRSGVLVATSDGFFEASMTMSRVSVNYSFLPMDCDEFLDRINQVDAIPQDYNPRAIRD